MVSSLTPAGVPTLSTDSTSYTWHHVCSLYLCYVRSSRSKSTVPRPNLNNGLNGQRLGLRFVVRQGAVMTVNVDSSRVFLTSGCTRQVSRSVTFAQTRFSDRRNEEAVLYDSVW